MIIVSAYENDRHEIEEQLQEREEERRSAAKEAAGFREKLAVL